MYTNPEQIADFMAANGIDRKQWLDTYNSFSVAARANRAGQIWRAYKIDGTPMVAVGRASCTVSNTLFFGSSTSMACWLK